MRGKSFFKRKARQWRCARLGKVVVGAGGTSYKGWVSTDRWNLDVCKIEDFYNLSKPNKIANFLSEHVWEHLTTEQRQIANSNIYKFLKPGGRFRIAVPDGFHRDPRYIENVRPGGSGRGAYDHKILFTHEILKSELEKCGFEVDLKEWWDVDKKFHYRRWSDEDGHVMRSSDHDTRNIDRRLEYTSLIVDGIKPL